MNGANRRHARKLLLDRQKGLCAICANPLDPAKATLDHIMPKSRGGSDHIMNLQVTHFGCNLQKADRWDWSQILRERYDEIVGS